MVNDNFLKTKNYRTGLRYPAKRDGASSDLSSEAACSRCIDNFATQNSYGA